MKNFLLVSAVLAFMFGCEPADPTAKPAPPAAPAAGEAATPPAKTAPAKPAAASGKSLRQEVSDAVDYGIGATQLRAKQKATATIDNINQQKNAELEKALKE
ncbi:MAG: hypothetical protein GX564_12045 [Oligosphaeraceae bacterium]|nr:hypothetical protein [Oligosphaeraceae bacterium]